MFDSLFDGFLPEGVLEAFETFLAEHLPNDDLPRWISDRLSDLDIPVFPSDGAPNAYVALPEQTDGLTLSFDVPRSDVAVRASPAAGSGLDIAADANAQAMPLGTSPELPATPMTLPAEIAKGVPDFLGWDFGATGSSGLASEVGITPGSQGAGTSDGRVEVMIELASGIGPDDIGGLIGGFGGEITGTVRFAGAFGSDAGAILTISLPNETVFETLKSALERSPMIETVELNGVRGLSFSDPYFTDGSLWGMTDTGGGSGANLAWQNGFTGSATTVVGVNDSGIDPTHPDLYLNIWINQDEIPTAIFEALNDVDGNDVITFHDLNDAANSGVVSDTNGNGFIDALDLLSNTNGWEDGIDSDGNGYTDDLFGWNWIDDNNQPFVLSTRDDTVGRGPFRQDTGSHGVHVAGTIGAIGDNGEGVVGVNWDTQIIAMKTFQGGSGTVADITAANNYFANLAWRATDPTISSLNAAYDFVATNNSYVDSVKYKIELQSIVDLASLDVLFVAAAGNSSNDLNPENLNAFPAEYDPTAAFSAEIGVLTSIYTEQIVDYDNVIAVAAIDSAGKLAVFSNYGNQVVDIAAPGEGIWSTIAGGGYGSKNGTSMAAPHVTGAVVLYAAANPDASAADIKAALLGSASIDGSLTSVVLGGKVLSIDQLLGTDPNALPVANDDAFTTVEDVVGFGGNVLADNGSGPDSDADTGDTLTATLVTDVSNGALTLNADGTFTYTPDGNFNGNDSFTYTVTDGKAVSNQATVTITIAPVNDAPVAVDDGLSTDMEVLLSGDVLADNGSGADFDVDDDSFVDVALVTGVSNGSLALNGDGTFTYTPNVGFVGTDSFTYTVSDGILVSNVATATITVNPVNALPVGNDDAFTTVEDVVGFGGNVLADNGSGPDSDADTGDTLTATLVTDVSNGALTLNADGTFTYTPDGNFNGNDSFTYTVTDGKAVSNQATVTITIAPVNDAPVAVDDGLSTDMEVLLSGDVLADNGSGADFDVDDDSFVDVALVTGVSNGSLALNGDGTFTYTPNVGFVGTDSFTYTVSDGILVSNVATATITVNPASSDVYGSDTANDTLLSKGGIISGLSKDGTFNGAGTVDDLYGMDLAADIFLLSDSRGVFYDDESNKPGGGNLDYARIWNFEIGLDKLGLASSANYLGELVGADTYIFLDVWRPGSDSRNELIAIVEGKDLTSGSGIDQSHVEWTDDFPIA